MVSDRIHEFVARSGVRRAVLHAVADGGATTDELLAAVDGSRSAVYKAVDALSEAGLVVRGDAGVATTGLGDVVAGCLADRERVARLLDGSDYWETHDVSVLPTRFRRRLPALSGAEVVESPDTYPTLARERARSLLSSAERVDAFHTVQDPERAGALSGQESGAPTRVVLDERLSPSSTGVPSAADGVSVRHGDVPCALYLTEDALLVQLPTVDGAFDDRAFLLAHTGPALAWGRDLFAFGWENASTSREETAVRSR